MPIRKVDVTEHFEQFIESGIESGKFNDANEIVREGLRLLEERQIDDEAKLHELRVVAQKGFSAIDAGDGLTFRTTAEFTAFIEKVEEEQSREVWLG